MGEVLKVWYGTRPLKDADLDNYWGYRLTSEMVRDACVVFVLLSALYFVCTASVVVGFVFVGVSGFVLLVHYTAIHCASSLHEVLMRCKYK